MLGTLQHLPVILFSEVRRQLMDATKMNLPPAKHPQNTGKLTLALALALTLALALALALALTLALALALSLSLSLPLPPRAFSRYGVQTSEIIVLLEGEPVPIFRDRFVVAFW